MAQIQQKVCPTCGQVIGGGTTPKPKPKPGDTLAEKYPISPDAPQAGPEWGMKPPIAKFPVPGTQTPKPDVNFGDIWDKKPPVPPERGIRPPVKPPMTYQPISPERQKEWEYYNSMKGMVGKSGKQTSSFTWESFLEGRKEGRFQMPGEQKPSFDPMPPRPVYRRSGLAKKTYPLPYPKNYRR